MVAATNYCKYLDSELSVCSEGKDGAIIGWDDGRNNSLSKDIYIQKVYKNGKVGGNTSMAIRSEKYINPKNLIYRYILIRSILWRYLKVS